MHSHSSYPRATICSTIPMMASIRPIIAIEQHPSFWIPAQITSINCCLCTRNYIIFVGHTMQQQKMHTTLHTNSHHKLMTQNVLGGHKLYVYDNEFPSLISICNNKNVCAFWIRIHTMAYASNFDAAAGMHDKRLARGRKKNKVKYPAYTFGPLFSNRHSHFRRQTILSQRCRWSDGSRSSSSLVKNSFPHLVDKYMCQLLFMSVQCASEKGCAFEPAPSVMKNEIFVFPTTE